VIKPSQLCKGTSEQSQTLDHPLRHLTACHRRIEERLDTLERVIPHWESQREEALAAVRNAFRFFDTNGVWHTQDEERSIFPRMQHGLTDDERAYLAELERQHVVAESAYEALRRLVAQLDTQAPTPQWVAEYEAAAKTLGQLYREHIASEDTRLVEIGGRILSAAELETISGEMKERRGLK
jgi:iron-sulfur cluster repair protein YtfE (RIC family)